MFTLPYLTFALKFNQLLFDVSHLHAKFHTESIHIHRFVEHISYIFCISHIHTTVFSSNMMPGPERPLCKLYRLGATLSSPILAITHIYKCQFYNLFSIYMLNKCMLMSCGSSPAHMA